MKYIERPHLVRYVLELLQQDSSSSVFVTGPTGAGKSAFVAECARSVAGPVLLFRVNARDRWGYNPELVRDDLLGQVANLLGITLVSDGSPEDTSRRYRALVAKLAKKARHEGRELLFVVDGFDTVPQEELSITQDLTELLPFGLEGVRYLVVSPPEWIPLPPSVRRSAKTFPLTPFSRAELEAAFSDLPQTREGFRAIESVSGGYPESLVAIHRLLSTDSSADALSLSPASGLMGLYELEWSRSGPFDSDGELALAALLEEPSFSSNERLAQAFSESGLPCPDLSRFSFLVRENGHTVFCSSTFATFAATKLESHKRAAIDLVVAFFVAVPQEDPGLDKVTRLLTSSGQSARVLAVLEGERFSSLVSSSDSLAAVARTSGRGIAAALAEDNPAAVLEFALQRASIVSYVAAAIGSAEIRVLVALGDTDAATALADSEQLLEARFRRYATLARACKEFHELIPPQVLETLRALFDLLPEAAFGTEALDVAGDLMFALPDLAVALVAEKAISARSENARDVHFALLALNSAALDEDGSEAPVAAANAASKIADPRLRSLTSALALSRAGQSAASLLAQLETLTATEDRVLLLESWMEANRERGDALTVLEFALSTVVSSAGYTATARTFRRLSRCLLFSSSTHELDYFVRVIDSHVPNLERIGPQPELHRLVLQLARAVWRRDQLDGAKRLTAAYDKISACADTLDRAAGLARLRGTLTLIDPAQSLETSLSLHSLVESDLASCVDSLLRTTADHAEALLPVVAALGAQLPVSALALARRLNQPYRRDRAHAVLVAAHLATSQRAWQLPALSEAIAAIGDPRVRDRALGTLHEAIQLRGLPPHWREIEGDVAALLRSSASPRMRAFGLTLLASRCGDADAAQELFREAEVAARQVSDSEGRVLALLGIAALGASLAPLRAKALVDEVRTAEVYADGADGRRAIDLSLGLAIRASVGLFRHGLMLPKQRARLLREIELIPEPVTRCSLLADLVVASTIGDAAHTVTTELLDELLRHLSDVPEEDVPTFTSAVAVSAPALCVGTSDATCATYLARLAPAFRDGCLLRTARLLRLSVLPNDPYEELPSTGRAVTFAVASRILDLAAQATSDATLFALVEEVILGVSSTEGLNKVSQAQRASLRARVESLAISRFPNPSGVAHEGFRLCIEILAVARLQGKMTKDQQAAFRLRANAVPNEADVVFCLAYLAAYGLEGERASLIEDTRVKALRLPSAIDRIDRLEMLARLVAPVDAGRSKSLLKSALEATGASRASSMEERRRELISLAYRISGTFAQGLAVASDDEPAKRSLDEAKRVHDVRSRFQKRDFVAVCEADERDLRRICDALIGALNARRLSPAKPEFLLAALGRVSALPLASSFPLLSLAIQSEVRRSESNARVASETVAALFDAALRAAGVARTAVNRLSAGRAKPLFAEATPTVRAESAVGGALTFVSGLGGPAIAQRLFEEWLGAQQGERILVCDPYFDIALLRLLTSIPRLAPGSSVVVITGPHIKHPDVFGADYETAVRDAWWRQTADSPPSIEIVVATFRGKNTCPIHDRWWISTRSGLDLGSSPSGFSGRLTTIRKMELDEALRTWTVLSQFANREQKAIEGKKIDYSMFTVD